MDILDYMNLVSGYIKEKIENKLDKDNSIDFTFKFIKDNGNNSYCVVEELENEEKNFFIKFPCSDKRDFYEVVSSLLIEYFKNSDMLLYTAIKTNKFFDRKFSIVTKNKVSVAFGIENVIDMATYLHFKNYLDEPNYDFKDIDVVSKMFNEDCNDILLGEDVSVLSKIML